MISDQGKAVLLAKRHEAVIGLAGQADRLWRERNPFQGGSIAARAGDIGPEGHAGWLALAAQQLAVELLNHGLVRQRTEPPLKFRRGREVLRDGGKGHALCHTSDPEPEPSGIGTPAEANLIEVDQANVHVVLLEHDEVRRDHCFAAPDGGEVARAELDPDDEVWTLGMCTWIGKGNDVTYSPTMTFETFPFPPGLEPNRLLEEYQNPHADRIAEAAKRLNELRENCLNPPDLIKRVPEVVAGYPDRIEPAGVAARAELKNRTLTNLYNARPAWLANAHAELDAAVAAAYGWAYDILEDEALKRLLALNLERSKAAQL